MPIKISDLNQIVENAVIKKNFNKNSSILIKQYKLDKNEKEWLNNYHKIVYKKLIKSMNKIEALNLRKACSAI